MPKSSRPSESTPSTSRYASPTNASFVQSSSQGQRQSLLSHSSHPLVSETTPSSPGTSSGSRRRSNTSSDSMDTSYYGHGHGYVPAGPSRSYAAADSTGGETPVKLTPITGRVSRAKKGVPVHICELCRPPKVRRHLEIKDICQKLLTCLVDIHKGRTSEVCTLECPGGNQTKLTSPLQTTSAQPPASGPCLLDSRVRQGLSPQRLA